jgi:serine/threonine-protein kinase
VGRYAIYDPIANGGMAAVHLGRLIGPIGFSRTVAIKRLHPQFTGDPEFSAMFLDEAKVAARIRHPNVVPVIDVIAEADELLLVMDYIHGESLAFLLRGPPGADPARLGILGNVMASVLHGLHAAHEATGDSGRPLGVVHRDVSPQNVLVGVDGVARVVDFGVAKAAGQVHHTLAGHVKGKIRYLAPEQVTCTGVDRRADIWSASVLLWEALIGQRLFTGDNDAAVLRQVLEKPIPSPLAAAPDLPEPIARVLRRGLERDRARRFSTALEMATELEAAVGLIPAREVGAWVVRLSRTRLEARRRLIDEIEAETVTGPIATAPESTTRPTRPQPARVQAASAASIAPPEPPPPVAERAVTLDPPPPVPRPRARTRVIAAAVVGAVAIAAFAAHVRGRAPPASVASAATIEEAPLVELTADPEPPAPSPIAAPPAASSSPARAAPPRGAAPAIQTAARQTRIQRTPR